MDAGMGRWKEGRFPRLCRVGDIHHGITHFADHMGGGAFDGDVGDLADPQHIDLA